jgi:hypothetical protein
VNVLQGTYPMLLIIISMYHTMAKLLLLQLVSKLARKLQLTTTSSTQENVKVNTRDREEYTELSKRSINECQ